jgi:hypothetical protein
MKDKKHNNNSVFMCSNFIPVILASVILLSAFNQNFLYSALAIGKSTIDDNPMNTKSDTSSTSSSSIIPNAKSVFDTGTMSLPASVSGYIVYIPDEAHHPLTDNKTISLKNAHYLPSNLIIPSGAAIAFVHGDPNHIHSEIVKDSSTGNIAWQTIPVKHPGGSDTKVLSPGSYTISDQKYAPMIGNITVKDNKQSKGNLVVGAFFAPTPLLQKYKSDFTAAGFQVLSEHNFLSKVVQKDIAGPTTLLLYSTAMPIQDAITNLKPIIASLPYR